MDGRALAEELGVGDDGDVGAAEGPLDDAGGSDRHGGLVDHHRLAREERPDLARGLLDVGEVGRAVRALGRGHAEVGELAVGDGVRGAEHELEPTVLQPFPHEVVEPGLEDRDLPPLEALHLAGVHVGADHVVADVREAGAGGESHVSGTDDSDLAHDSSASRTQARSSRTRRSRGSR